MEYRYLRFDAREREVEERVRALLGIYHQLLLHTDGDVDTALEYLDRIGQRAGLLGPSFTIEDFKRYLEREKAVVKKKGGGLALTKKGEAGLKRASLEAVFSRLERGVPGEHRVHTQGWGTERLAETRPYAFGDPIASIDTVESVSNALRRSGIETISLDEEDLRVFETEHSSACATVLLLDVSHSMVLYGEDRITPAKQVALALCELITTRYPKDSLEMVLFGDEAHRVPLAEIPYVKVGPYHTNTKAGLEMAREILRKKPQQNRQIFMLTDGKPSALSERDGGIYKNPFGLDTRIVNKTLEEADLCRRLGIPITTFMLARDPLLVDFVETFTRVNRGRAYYSGLDRLGSLLFVDYLTNRRRRS